MPQQKEVRTHTHHDAGKDNFVDPFGICDGGFETALGVDCVGEDFPSLNADVGQHSSEELIRVLAEV
jgi:hypothetical protein